MLAKLKTFAYYYLLVVYLMAFVGGAGWLLSLCYNSWRTDLVSCDEALPTHPCEP